MTFSVLTLDDLSCFDFPGGAREISDILRGKAAKERGEEEFTRARTGRAHDRHVSRAHLLDIGILR